MDTYINIGNEGFHKVMNSDYADKSGLISIVISILFTEYRFSCVSRSHCFVNSLVTNMLCTFGFSRY